MGVIELKDSMLQSLFSEQEYARFKEIIFDVSQKYKDVKGVLVTGSLVQRVQLANPSPPHKILDRRASAYAQIVGRTKRKIFPSANSDLDMWVLTEEQEGNETISTMLTERGLDLLEWYASQGDNVDLSEWIRLKCNAFDEFYKQSFLYSENWRAGNSNPAHATGFKQEIEEQLERTLPGVRDKVNYYFRRDFRGQFIEVRAFPPSVFNLKTERIMIGNQEDRTPFTFYIRDWVDLEKNCLVVYCSNEQERLTYPFNPQGTVPGAGIAQAIGWTQRDIDSILYSAGKRQDE